MRILLILLLFAANVLFARWYYVCQVRQQCGESTAAPAADERLQTLRLLQGDTVLLEGYDQFRFDSASVLPDVNENNSRFLDTVAALLQANPQQSLTITGFYRPGEDSLQAGMYENLGVARADAVRKLLLKRGVSEQRISLDYNRSTDSLLREPLTFRFYTPADNPTSFETVQFSFTNMTFSDANFEFDSDVFKPGEPFKLYADSVKTYLDLNPDKRLTIIGHTDDVGADRYNINLGLRRGRSARAYFQNLGVSSKITVDSRGERRPVATNDTEEGRQKNRRVNFILE
jgi:OOP family OmpA-OmpF porin